MGHGAWGMGIGSLKLVFIPSAIQLTKTAAGVKGYNEGMGHGAWDWKSKISIYSFCDTTHKTYFLCMNCETSAGLYIALRS